MERTLETTEYEIDHFFKEIILLVKNYELNLIMGDFGVKLVEEN